MTDFPRGGQSYAALKHFAAASSYFTYFLGTQSENEVGDLQNVKKMFENPSFDFMNAFLSLYSTKSNASEDEPPRSFLEYLPFINPTIRSFHPNLIVNEETNVEPPPAEFPHAYKTVMCEAWLINAYCGYGKNCRFAHGVQELRPTEIGIRDTSKYQTKVCIKYTTNGICPYGTACLFYHPLPENPQVLMDALAAVEKRTTPSEVTNEYYMMSRSFYMEAQSFENPYNASYEVIEDSDKTKLENEPAHGKNAKVLDLVFDENGNIIQHIVTSKSTSDTTK